MAGSKRRSGADMAGGLEAYAAAWKRTGMRHGDDVMRMRAAAWQQFVERGFPTTREEEWRFTNVGPIAEREFLLAAASPDLARTDVAPFRLPGAVAAEMVFVNGHYVPELSRLDTVPSGVRAASLASSLAADDGQPGPWLGRVAPFKEQPFVALNTAFLDDGGYIELDAGTTLQHPIHLLFVATGDAHGGKPVMVHPRVFVVLGANSQAAIVETYVGPAGARYFTNTVADVVLGDNAVLDHYKLQYESDEAYHIGAFHVQAKRSATCTAHSISVGGALVRNDVVAVLDGEGAECTLNGLYLADAHRLVDHHTTIDHAQAHCGSREVYKGILADHARGVFNGKIIVRPDAQKTDAKQTNRALLLSEDALINTKPQLEIFANDVKCTHGAAVGQLDEDALFYLRSRGLGEAAARQLLIHAFAADVLNRLPLASVRAGVEVRLQDQLARTLHASTLRKAG